MKTIPRTPARKDVINLEEGDLVFNCFGQLEPVVKITSRGFDTFGNVFVTFYQRWTDTSTMSGSIKEDERIYFVHD
jgi:hypothetical protein